MFRDDRIEVRLPMARGTDLLIATNPPWRYSDLVAWLGALQEGRRAGVRVGSRRGPEVLGAVVRALARDVPPDWRTGSTATRI